MFKTAVILSTLIFCISCSSENKPEEKKEEQKELIFDKLIGVWKLDDEEHEQYEVWKNNGDGTYSSTVFTIEGKDTVITERIHIFQREGKWDFETIVSGQNKGKPVDFLHTILNDTVVQFDNPNHDFPKLINYTMKTPRNVRAFIAGTTDTIYFNYVKVYTGVE